MAVGVLSSVKVDSVAGSFSGVFTADGTPTATFLGIGFKPRVIKMTQISGTPGNASQTLYHESMAAASNVQITAAGALTIPSTNGFTLYDGSTVPAASPAAASPTGAGGPGFTIGTGPQVTASAAYLLEAYR